jgi:hypothetical protein
VVGVFAWDAREAMKIHSPRQPTEELWRFFSSVTSSLTIGKGERHPRGDPSRRPARDAVPWPRRGGGAPRRHPGAARPDKIAADCPAAADGAARYQRYQLDGDATSARYRSHIYVAALPHERPVTNEQETKMRTGNSLAYLLCQEQNATADVRVVSRARTRKTGNSLAYLISQEQNATANVRVLRPISRARRAQASQAAA